MFKGLTCLVIMLEKDNEIKLSIMSASTTISYRCRFNKLQLYRRSIRIDVKFYTVFAWKILMEFLKLVWLSKVERKMLPFIIPSYAWMETLKGFVCCNWTMINGGRIFMAYLYKVFGRPLWQELFTHDWPYSLSMVCH